MGSFTSKDFVDLMEEEEEIPNTPVSNKRLIGLDPRSPTSGIARTPIQVEKTPEKLNDPRSPTVGIMRTPIVNTDESHDSSASSTISSLNISSASNCSLSDIQPLSIQAALDCLPPLDFDEDVSETQPEPAEKVPTPPQSPVIIGKKEYTPKLIIKSRRNSATFHVHSDSNDASDQPKPALRAMPDGMQRSPLGKRNIDISSPRHIVQRKQANKLGMLKAAVNNAPGKNAKMNSPCGMEVLNAEDKENISL